MSADPCSLTLLEQLKALCRDDHPLGEDDLPEDFVLVEDDGWTQDHKDQYCACIYKHEPSGRHFQINNSRSGSYHTDWYYSTPEVYEVTPEVKVITTTIWNLVKG